MGVLVLMSHLIVTLAFIVVYVTFAYLGKPVTTIENMLLVIVGYWFGAMGVTSVRPNTQTNVHNAQEVKVNQPETEKEVEK